MGLNFRKTLKIAPGIKINVSKKGVSSLSIGKNGSRVNIGKKGAKTTLGINGTGLSYSKYNSFNNKNTAPPPLPVSEKDSESMGFGALLIIGLIMLFPIIWFFG